MPQYVPLGIGAAVGVADGVLVHMDGVRKRWWCFKSEYPTWERAGVLAAGLGMVYLSRNDPGESKLREVGQSLSVAGAYLLASRVSLGIARGSGSPGSGCPK